MNVSRETFPLYKVRIAESRFSERERLLLYFRHWKVFIYPVMISVLN